MTYRPRSHHYLCLLYDFLGWIMFLAVWIALAEQVSCDTARCAAPGGGHLHTKPCSAVYAALAFAVMEWILFTVSFIMVANNMWRNKEQNNTKGEGSAV